MTRSGLRHRLPNGIRASVQDPGVVSFCELAYGIGDPAPHRFAVAILLRRKFISPRGAFLEGLAAVPLQHEVCGAPDVDLGYHTRKVARLRVGGRAATRRAQCGKARNQDEARVTNK